MDPLEYGIILREHINSCIALSFQRQDEESFDIFCTSALLGMEMIEQSPENSFTHTNMETWSLCSGEQQQKVIISC